MSTFSAYHVHIYFDGNTMEQARELIHQAGNQFKVNVGRMHEQPIGPHPVGSCQLSFAADQFGELIPWLAKHRQGLNVLVHPESDDDWLDHTEYAMWLGEPLTLDTSLFSRR